MAMNTCEEHLLSSHTEPASTLTQLSNTHSKVLHCHENENKNHSTKICESLLLF